MTEAELTALARGALVGLGIAAEDALAAARILVMGDLFGHHTHGVMRLESYGQRIELGAIRTDAAIAIETVSPSIVRIDGASALGPLVGMRSLDAAMARARDTGVGVALVRNGNHFGAIGPYCYLAAEAGFASIVGCPAKSTASCSRRSTSTRCASAASSSSIGARHDLLQLRHRERRGAQILRQLRRAPGRRLRELRRSQRAR